MKRTVLKQKATPYLPCILLIGTVIFWFLLLLTDNGEWVVRPSGLSFDGLAGFQIAFRLLAIISPVALFLTMLFLTEFSLYWIFIPLLLPVIHQTAQYFYNLDTPDLILDVPLQFALPFLTFLLFALTALRILPTKWIFFGFCLIAALLPAILTACGTGEYVYTEYVSNGYYAAPHEIRDWSEVLTQGTYYLALGTYVFSLAPDCK